METPRTKGKQWPEEEQLLKNGETSVAHTPLPARVRRLETSEGTLASGAHGDLRPPTQSPCVTVVNPQDPVPPGGHLLGCTLPVSGAARSRRALR